MQDRQTGQGRGAQQILAFQPDILCRESDEGRDMDRP
jgi:hypothetical protein